MGFFLSNQTAVDRFWRGYFAALLPTFSRKFSLNRVRVFHDLCVATNDPAITWCGPVLIMEAGGDTLFTAQERTRLYEAYPQAKRIEIAAEGHGSALRSLDAHIAAYRSFWEGFDIE